MPEVDSTEPPETGPATSLGSEDFSDLPDDPQALMMASLNRPLSRVARKMAYSGNKSFIPVLLEFMRFQPLEEGSTTVASFMSRIKDSGPPDEAMVFPPEQSAGTGGWNGWASIQKYSLPTGMPAGRDGSIASSTREWGPSYTTA